MLFLGTGAAELSPNPFCECEICEELSKNKENRKRSAMLFNDENLVDFGPEVVSAAQMYNAKLYKVRNVFITHSHEDHFSLSTFTILTMSPCTNPIDFYLSTQAYSWMRELIIAEGDIGGTWSQTISKLENSGKIRFREVQPYKTIQVGKLLVTPIIGSHTAYGKNEQSYNYIFEENGSKFLYASDTGTYCDKTYEFLKNMQIETVVMEGTLGDNNVECVNHLNAKTLCMQINKMKENKSIKENATLYVTHINTKQSLSQDKYQKYMNENCSVKTIVAYDGLRA